MAQVEAAKGKLPDVVFRRCRHVVSENARAAEGSRESVAASNTMPSAS